jgi:hypothetical protein
VYLREKFSFVCFAKWLGTVVAKLANTKAKLSFIFVFAKWLGTALQPGTHILWKMIAPLAREIDRFPEAYKIQALKSDCENRTKPSIITSTKQNEHCNHVPVLYIQSSMKE